MNIVYKITFIRRKNKKDYPYYYIGSKSNCYFENNKIIQLNDHKEYYGSSNCKFYKDAIKKEKNHLLIEILYENELYENVIEYEKQQHIKNNVVESIEYFNKGIATVSNFSDPNYATYKHYKTGKIVRLKRNNPKVLSGEFIGITKGNILSEDHKNKIGNGIRGEKNGFYGKTHSKETKDLIRDKKISRGDQRSKDQIKEWIENVAKKPKTEEHKRKIGRKGMIMLKNLKTSECIRIPKEEKYNYDENLWVNPIKYKKLKGK